MKKYGSGDNVNVIKNWSVDYNQNGNVEIMASGKGLKTLERYLKTIDSKVTDFFWLEDETIMVNDDGYGLRLY